jgi:hypothetical protein
LGSSLPENHPKLKKIKTKQNTRKKTKKNEIPGTKHKEDYPSSPEQFLGLGVLFTEEPPKAQKNQNETKLLTSNRLLLKGQQNQRATRPKIKEEK